MKPLALYTLARLMVTVAIAGLLWLLGLNGFPLLMVAILLSLPVSYLLLARQRAVLAGELEQQVNRRRTRREEFRARLRGEDTTDDG